MKKCEEFEELLKKYISEDLNDKDKFLLEEHISACQACKKEYESYKLIIDSSSEIGKVEQNKLFMDNLWGNISPKLDNPKPVYSSKLKSRGLGLKKIYFQVGLAAALLIIGIIIGKNYFTEGYQTNEANNNTETAQKARIELINKTEKYLEKSKILLLGLMNFDPKTEDAYALDIPRHKAISRKLLNESLSLKSGLKEIDELKLKKLVSELELILIQIANLESEKDISGIELIQSSVEYKGIMVKININELNNIKSGNSLRSNSNNSTKKI